MYASRRVLGGWVTALCGLGACLGPNRPAVDVAPAQVLQVTSREGQFPNGLRVIIETVEDSDIAGIALAIDAGSAKDPKAQGGLAHLVEHDVFESHPNDAPSVERRLNQLAAAYNAETSHDAVVYHAFAPKRAFDGVLQVFADIAAEPLANVGSTEFEHQKQVVEAERSVRTEHVQGQVAGFLYDAIFPRDHPYARPVIGTRESVAGLDSAMAQAFVTANYRPESMTLYVVAPSSLEPFTRVSAAFAAHAGGKLTPVDAQMTNALSSPLSLKPAGSLVVHDSSAVATPELWLAWPLPGGTIEQRARAKSLAQLTGALIRPSFTSHPAVAHTDCELTEQVLGDVLSCKLVLNDTSDTESVIVRTLADLREGFGKSKNDHGWSWSVQREAAVDATLELESLQARATVAAEQAREYGNPFLDREVLSALGALDLGKVTSLGYELADRSRTFAMLIRPNSGASSAVGGQQETREQRNLEPDGDAPDTAQTLALVKRESPRELRQFVLKNGLTVVAQRRRGTPFVTAILGFHGSSTWASDPSLGEAARLSESWRVDTSPSQVGLSLRWDEGQDDRHFMARAVAPDLDAVLKALARERFPHFDWPNLRFRRMLPALTRAENSYHALAARQERTALFGSHPYSAFAPAARADSITTQAVDRFLLSVRRPDNAVLVIVSDAEPSAIQAGVEEYFGSWAKPNGPKLAAPAALDLEASHPPALVIVDRPSSQVDLSFSCLIPPGSGKAHAAQEILADLLRTHAEVELRHQTGIAYFAGGWFRALAAGADEISVTTSVDVTHVSQALPFLKRLGKLSGDELTDKTLAWRRFQALESSAFRDQTTFTTAHSLYGAWLEQRPMTDLDRESEFLASVTQSDLAPALAECARHAVIVAVGNRPAIAAADRQ